VNTSARRGAIMVVTGREFNRINRLAKQYNTQVITRYPIKLGKYKVKSTRYPLRRIIERFGTEFFNSTIDYMIAYALYKGYNHIKLYGVDMTTKQEYWLQKGGIEYWIGYARGLGAKVDVCEGSLVMVTASRVPYGIRKQIDLKGLDPYNVLQKR